MPWPESAFGTERTYRDVCYLVVFGGKADISHCCLLSETSRNRHRRMAKLCHCTCAGTVLIAGAVISTTPNNATGLMSLRCSTGRPCACAANTNALSSRSTANRSLITRRRLHRRCRSRCRCAQLAQSSHLVAVATASEGVDCPPGASRRARTLQSSPGSSAATPAPPHKSPQPPQEE